LQLPQIVCAGDGVRLLLGSSQRGQQETSENCDDRDHDEKFDQSET
jgi:hypothetical protein